MRADVSCGTLVLVIALILGDDHRNIELAQYTQIRHLVSSEVWEVSKYLASRKKSRLLRVWRLQCSAVSAHLSGASHGLMES